MEIKTIIENSQAINFQIPVFKHPLKQLKEMLKLIVQKIFLFLIKQFQNILHNFHKIQIKKDVLFYMVMIRSIEGFEMKLQDWKIFIDHHGLNEKKNFSFSIIKFKGNQQKKIDGDIINTKSFLKGQKVLNDSLNNSDKRNKNQGLTVFRVNLGINQNIVLYYIPFCQQIDVSMSQIKLRYFNNKFLQILNQYVTLDNSNTTCYKDEAHQNFQYLVYSGNVSSFTVFIKINDKILQPLHEQICQRFIQKISNISLTDKHLLDEMDTSNLVELKREIKQIYLQENRLRMNITQKKTKVVEELDKILQLFDLKHYYPNKLNFSNVNEQMFKRIKNKNVQKNQQWIQQRKIINDNLDLRIKDLQKIKAQLLQKELLNQKNQRNIIQNIRNQIIDLEKQIQYEKSQINNRLFEETRKEREKQKLKNLINKTKIKDRKISQSIKVNQATIKKQTIHQIQNLNRNYSQILQQIKKQESQKNLKSQMIRYQFQIQKQFVQKRQDYKKAAQEIFNYLIDF